MTVGQLKAALEKYPDDMGVIVYIDTQEGIEPPRAFEFVGEELPIGKVSMYNEIEDEDMDYVAICVED